MELNDTVRKLLYTEQAERHLTMPRCQKGNTFPDEGWHNGDDELVNRGLVQEGTDDLASAHHPDVLASPLAQALGKGTDRLGDELDALGNGSGRRPPREHIVQSTFTEARAHLQTPVEGFAAQDLGIGGALELRETVETLGSWPFCQPIEIAIGSSHEAVGARRNIDNDFSLWHDTPQRSVSRAPHARLDSTESDTMVQRGASPASIPYAHLLLQVDVFDRVHRMA